MKIDNLPFGTVDWNAGRSHHARRRHGRSALAHAALRRRARAHARILRRVTWPTTGAPRGISCCASKASSRRELADGRRFTLTPGHELPGGRRRRAASLVDSHRSEALCQSTDVGRDGYEISTDPARLDIAAMHAYLTRSYWSPGIPRDIVERAARNSLCFGVYETASGSAGRFHARGHRPRHVRLSCDVYVLEEHRGHGLGKCMMREVMAHPGAHRRAPRDAGHARRARALSRSTVSRRRPTTASHGDRAAGYVSRRAAVARWNSRAVYCGA